MEEGAQEPYKHYGKIQVYSPDEGVDCPKTDSEVVTASKHVVSAEGNVLLPKQFSELETDFKKLYDQQYEKGGWIEASPRRLDFLYQQYGLTKDRQKRRTGFNSFGLYALSYLDGIRTVGKKYGYLGSSGWGHIVKEKYQALLLGCSSITTADQFFRFSQAVNPDMLSMVTDINPLATKLAQEAIPKDSINCKVIESDVQRIPLKKGSVDFIATNYLVYNLIDKFGTGKDTLQQVLNEASRVLSDEGVLVMVEQLSKIDLSWLAHWAQEAGLKFSHGLLDYDTGTLRNAVILPSHDAFDEVIRKIPNFIEVSAREVAHDDVYQFKKDPRKHFKGETLPSVSTLIFIKKTK